jgi:hypothetical protein
LWDLRCASLCIRRLLSFLSSSDNINLGLPRFPVSGCVPTTWGCYFTSSIQLNN